MGKGWTRVTRKNQVTIPVSVMEAAGLTPEDVVVVRADGAGRVVVERSESLVEHYAESLRGTWASGGGFLRERKRTWG